MSFDWLPKTLLVRQAVSRLFVLWLTAPRFVPTRLWFEHIATHISCSSAN